MKTKRARRQRWMYGIRIKGCANDVPTFALCCTSDPRRAAIEEYEGFLKTPFWELVSFPAPDPRSVRKVRAR